MNQVVPHEMGQVASAFANHTAEATDLSAGIQGGFGHIGYKGKVWSIRYRGQEVQLMRDDGDGPRNSIEIVILKANAGVSKIYYEGQFVEGSHFAPDCYSTNGVTPDIGSQKKQSVTCASCPKNAWGSKITPEGKQSKACGDSRRLAVVPAQDLRNEVYGGPMLLRVPASSLRELAQYGSKMAHLGYPYYAIVTRVSFDPASAFPKFQFGAIRPLTNEEAQVVIGMQGGVEVTRVLGESDFNPQPSAVTPVVPALTSAFEQPPQLAAPAPAASGIAQQGIQPVTQQVTGGGFGPVSAPVQVAPPAQNNVVPIQQSKPTPAPTPVAPPEAAAGSSDFEAALDAKLGELLPPS